MYVSSEDVNAGAPIISASETSLQLPSGATGGWVAAVNYFTRSMLNGNMRTNVKFIQVSTNGTTGSTNSVGNYGSIVYNIAL